MRISSIERWRQISKGNVPNRFESSLNKFRYLNELTNITTKRRLEQPDKRIEVDTETTPNILNMATSLEDPAELDQERKEERDRQLKFIRARLQTLKWIKRQARKDFNMIGGTSPTGAMSGSGGSDGYRPVSFQARQ